MIQARMYHDASQCVQNGRTQAATKLQLSCNQAATKLQPSCNQAATKLHAKCNVASSMHHRCMHIACAVDATVMHRPWTVHASSTVCSYIKAVLYVYLSHFVEIWLVIMYTFGNNVYQSHFRGNMAGNYVW